MAKNLDPYSLPITDDNPHGIAYPGEAVNPSTGNPLRDLIQISSPDTVAECWDGISSALYTKLWDIAESGNTLNWLAQLNTGEQAEVVAAHRKMFSHS